MDKMCKKSQTLRALVNERLTAAAEDIFALFERTIAEYEEELCRSKEENERRKKRREDAPCHSSGIQRLTPCSCTEQRGTKEKCSGFNLNVQLKAANEPQTKEFESSTCLDQENSEMDQIKQEQEEMSIKQEEELGYPSVIVQIDDEEEEKSLVTDFSDEDWAKRGEATASSSTQNMDTEANGEDVPTKNPPKTKSYVCGECGKAFGWRATWRRHVATHSETSPYTCSICSKRFPQKSHLVTHMVTHTGEKPFSCSECNTKFSQKQNLVRHMIIHSGEKSYSCPICGKQFSHKHSVQLHMLTHTGEKPFSCSLCDSRFTKKPHLNRHMKCCHNGEKPYSCPVCQKSFIQKFDVQRHMKVHTRNTTTSEPNSLDRASGQELTTQSQTYSLS